MPPNNTEKTNNTGLAEVKDLPPSTEASSEKSILIAYAEEYKRLYPSTENTQVLKTNQQSAKEKLIVDLKNFCSVLKEINLSNHEAFHNNEDSDLIFLIKFLSDFSLELLTDIN